MTPTQVLVALGCVALISAGQLLFKWTGLLLAAGSSARSLGVVATLLTALALYGIATLAWVWLLRHAPLTQAYPYMAASFVLVPAASALLFGERVGGPYIAGILLIVVGLLLTTR